METYTTGHDYDKL